LCLLMYAEVSVMVDSLEPLCVYWCMLKLVL